MYKVKLGFSYMAYLLVLALHIQCKNDNELKLQDTKVKTHNITIKDIENIKYTEYVLSDLAEHKTKDWLQFQILLSHIEVLKKGEMSFFKNDNTILKSFITDLKNEIPKSLKITSIMVRLTVLETTLLKLDEILNLQNVTKQSISSNIKNVLIAHNNLILQINKKLEKDSQIIVKPQKTEN